MKIIKLLIIIIFSLNLMQNSIAQSFNKVDKISKNLRCLICQGQSIYDSQSDFALSMKILIQKKLKKEKKKKKSMNF